MKPPSRQRIVPQRFRLKRSEPNHKFSKLWYHYELRSLLCGLKQQKTNSNLNLSELRKKVPKRSLLEIQNQIRYLRTCVVRRVYQQVKKQRLEEQRAKAPVEIWAEVARKMAGVHEETISSAFSQMLVIAATEPCSLVHSDPPRSTGIPVDGNLNTTPRTHIFRSLPARRPSSTPPQATLPAQDNAAPAQSPDTTVRLSPSALATTLPPLVQTSSASHVEQNSSSTKRASRAGQQSAVPSCEPASGLAVSSPATLTPAPSALSTATVTRSLHCKQTGRGQPRQPKQSKSDGNKYVVDYEKIYQIISNINKGNYSLPLSAMESAVLLDLLMSLPEELPLLDCRELQHHLLQVYKRLTTAAVMPISFPSTDQSAVTDPVSDRVTQKQSTVSHRDVEDTDVSLQMHSVQTAVEKDLQTEDDSSAATEQVKTSGDADGDWEGVGLCPLNPFMVPVGLLKRQKSKDSVELVPPYESVQKP